MNSFLFFYPEAVHNETSERKFAEINGAMVEYTEVGGVCRAVRLISSDPKQYLNSQCSPGADITEAVNSAKK
jgi:hypothetical protein